MDERPDGHLEQAPEETTSPLPPVATGEPPEAEPVAEVRFDRPRVSKLQVLAISCFAVALLALLVPILGLADEPDTDGDKDVAAATSTTSKPEKPTTTKKSGKNSSEGAGEVDVIDPDDTERANANETRNKLVAGGTAVVLAGVVFTGRRVRKKADAKKAE